MATNKSKNTLSFILYSPKFGPRYFSISRRLFNLFCLGPSFIAVGAIALTILGFVYFKQLREVGIYKKQRLIESLKNENEGIRQKLAGAEELNRQFQDKLSSRLPANARATNLLSIIAPSAGRKNATGDEVIDIEQFRTRRNSQETHISFNIVNELTNRRSSGFIFVILKANNTYTLWPQTNNEENLQYKFNEGEYFSTARFRPVEASFAPLAEDAKALFHIIIFSATGDIIYEKTHGPKNSQ